MNKLLTTITLLCFSVAANADIWFYETVALAILNDEAGYVYDEGQSYIIDTDEGYHPILRRLRRGSSYAYACN